MTADRDDERIDLNLDEETGGDSEYDAVLAEATAESTVEAAALSPEAAERLRAEKEELEQALIRLQADFENYRKRIDRERREDVHRATALVVEGLLPVLDAFERALATLGDSGDDEFRKGFELIYRQLQDGLRPLGLERIVALGKAFDPHYHQAVERVETTEHEDGAVISELQTGYRLRDRVLRPAMVRVASRPESPESTSLTSIT